MRPFGRFRRRVLAHGLVVLILMASTVAIADRLFVNRWVQAELVARRVRVNSELAVYGADHALASSSSATPVPPPPADAWSELAGGSETITRGDVVMTGLFRDGVFAGALVRRLAPPLQPYPGPPLPVVLLTLIACIGVTLLATIPLSRSVVRPIEALVRSVNRFGTGDLAARARIARGDEIGDLGASFDDMAARIESLVRRDKRQLANVSHELRTPLARIRVVLELASDGDAARAQSYLAEIAHDLAELEGLVDDVLTAAELDAGAGRVTGSTATLRLATVRVSDLIERSRARFASLHPTATLAVVSDRELPEIECDADRVRRALDNLLENAAKYAEGSRIEVAVRAEEDAIRVEVADEGPGMSREVAARAFEPFFRADESRDRRTGGVGLGLSIVRSIVEAHGGMVTLDSAPGRGTKVTVRLPQRQPA